MPNKKVVYVIGAILVLAFAAGIFVFARGDKSAVDNGANVNANANPDLPTAIKMFFVEKPNFVVRGENLSKVDIYAMVGGEQRLLGSAKLSADETSTSETWTMRIPNVAGATDISALGYDASGQPAARMSLEPQDLQSL